MPAVQQLRQRPPRPLQRVLSLQPLHTGAYVGNFFFFLPSRRYCSLFVSESPISSLLNHSSLAAAVFWTMCHDRRCQFVSGDDRPSPESWAAAETERYQPELMSSDMRRELERQDWEKQQKQV